VLKIFFQRFFFFPFVSLFFPPVSSFGLPRHFFGFLLDFFQNYLVNSYFSQAIPQDIRYSSPPQIGSPRGEAELLDEASLSFFSFLFFHKLVELFLFNHLSRRKCFYTHIPFLLSVAGTLSKERGGEELHRDRLLRHAHSQCASSQCTGEPPVVHTVHPIPTRNRSGTRQNGRERKDR